MSCEWEEFFYTSKTQALNVLGEITSRWGGMSSSGKWGVSKWSIDRGEERDCVRLENYQ